MTLEDIFTWSNGLKALLAVLPIGAVSGWVRFNERRWRFSSRKSKVLRKLIEKDEWRKAPPLHLQYALQDAFGRSLEPVELAFIETRVRPLQLLRDRMDSGGLVRLADDVKSYERTSKGAWLSFGTWSKIWQFFAAIAGASTIATVLGAVQSGKYLLLIVAFNIAALSLLAFWASNMLDAAGRVLSLKWHPEMRDIPPDLKKPKGDSKKRVKVKSTTDLLPAEATSPHATSTLAQLAMSKPEGTA